MPVTEIYFQQPSVVVDMVSAFKASHPKEVNQFSANVLGFSCHNILNE